MPESHEDSSYQVDGNIALLPRSGVGVDGPRLIIAPPGNPVITLDARYLDKVGLIGRPSASAFLTSAFAAGAGVAAVVSGLLGPTGYVAAAGFGLLAQDRFSAGRRRLRKQDILLVLGSLEVALHIADGPEQATAIVERLGPYTRGAPITNAEVYEHARARLRGGLVPESAASSSAGAGLTFGRDAVRIDDDRLWIGQESYSLEEVRDAAKRGEILRFRGGKMLQAAMGMLVAAAQARAQAGEDLDGLASKVAKYEEWSGRSAGR